MLIDWFTVVAQVVNFIILALLLRRFLYGPVTRAIAQRKQKIADELAEAEAIRHDALLTKARYEEKYRELETERDQLLAQARSEAETEKQWRLKEVAKQAEELRTKLMRSFAEEKQAIHHQITRRAGQEVFEMARKTLRDLASQHLETYIVDDFVRTLHDASPRTRQDLKKARNQTESDQIILRSAFDLTPSQQRQVAKALSKLLEEDHDPPQFEINEELICGIELQINHHKIEWHAAGYLQAMGASQPTAN